MALLFNILLTLSDLYEICIASYCMEIAINQRFRATFDIKSFVSRETGHGLLHVHYTVVLALCSPYKMKANKIHSLKFKTGNLKHLN